MAHMLMTKDTMMSVRETPWHGKGKVLKAYPESIAEALEESGLGWRVKQGDVLVAEETGVTGPMDALKIADRIAAAYSAKDYPVLEQAITQYGEVRPGVTPLTRATEFRANRREDDGAILGIVSNDYKIVQNEEAFKFLDALIGSDLHFETAGSLMNGKKVWVLARLPEWIEVGGDDTAMFVYVANAHDGSMAVTASATDVRIVCNNTLTWALSKSEYGEAAARTFKFRHTGDLQLKFDEARKVMGMTLNYAKQFKEMGDKLATKRMTKPAFEKVVAKIYAPLPEDAGKIAITNREKRLAGMIDLFAGKGKAGDTRGNSPGTKWCAVNAICEYMDWERRYTKKTDQMARSFEDTGWKQRALDLVIAA